MTVVQGEGITKILLIPMLQQFPYRFLLISCMSNSWPTFIKVFHWQHCETHDTPVIQ